MSRTSTPSAELAVDDWSAAERTVELCGHEQDRRRCMRDKAHTGPHECLTLHGSERWR